LTLRDLSRGLLVRYLVTVGLVLAAAEGVLYTLVRRRQHHAAEITLRKEVERIASLTLLDAHLAEVSENPGAPLSREPVSWQVLFPDGGALGWSSDLHEESPPLPAVGGNDLPLEAIHVAHDVHEGAPVLAARLRTLRVRNFRRDRPELMPPQMVFDIRAVMSRAVVDSGLDRLRWYLLAGFPLSMGVVAFGGLRLIQEAVRPVKRALERERRFTGAVSHELRTPLTALRGEVEVALRRPRAAAEYAETLQAVGGIAREMSTLVEELLVLARAESGLLLLGAATVRVDALVDRLRETARLVAPELDIAVTCRAPADTHVRGDAALLSVAVRNLLENAVRHGGGGMVALRVDEDGGALVLSVDDEGRGLPSEIAARLDEDGSALLAGKDGRARFGLAISRAVAEAHGGRLLVASRPAGGSTVSIRVPCAAAEEA
jgi:signal transduction histidine kinase